MCCEFMDLSSNITLQSGEFGDYTAQLGSVMLNERNRFGCSLSNGTDGIIFCNRRFRNFVATK